MSNTEDLSSDYQAHVAERDSSASVNDMESWLTQMRSGAAQPVLVSDDPSDPASERRLPKGPPPRRPGTGPLGTPAGEESVAGAIVGSVGEVVPAALKGVNEAVMNATPFIAPLADWLDANVADLTIKYEQPKTAVGGATKGISQFLTGFIPLMQGMKKMGAAGKIAPPMIAGAVSDFLTRTGAEGRLADVWTEAGLPKNVLTDYLATDKEDPGLEGRFKNAIEGAGIGLLGEGIFMAARGLRGMRKISKATTNEQQVIEAKYGKLSDEEFDRLIGDPSKPVMETRVHTPPVAGQKIKEGLEDTKKFTPRSVIRSKRRKKALYRGETGRSSEFGFWTSPQKATAKAYGPVTEFDASGLNVFDYKDAGQVKALAEAAGIKVSNTGRAARDLEEAMQGAFQGADDGVGAATVASGVRAKKWLVDNGYDAVRINVEEDSVFVLRPDKVKSRVVSSGDFEVAINFNRIDAPEQVKFAMGKMAEAMKGSIDEARRGTITFEETTKLADDLGMSVTDLLARRKGQTFNAEEALAARNLWAASGTRLVELAKKAANPNAGPLDQFEFRKAMATHAAIQSEVIGARTETARALASWRIEAKGRTEQLRAIDQTMQAMGGPQQSAELARRLAILAEHGDPKAIAKFVERGWGAKTADAIREVWVNGLLTNPMTHAVNTSSNLLVAFSQIYERAAAMGIRQFKGGEGVAPGEATAMAYGMVESLKDAFRMAGKTLKTGETSLGFNKLDDRPRALSSESLRIAKETGMGRAVDFIGSAVRVPGRLLQTEDEFFKTIGYRMELRAQALRTASQEGHKGAGLATRIEEIMRDPPEHIRINAADAAMVNTFTNEMGSFGKAMMNLRNIDHPLNPMIFVLPFIRTPVNIARYAFERTPFAPLVSQWRADIVAGGARADLALAKMSTGTAIMTVAMDLADSGLITGAGPKGEDKDVGEALQRQGIPPYSFKVGDHWVSYNRADPFGMTLGFAASIAEAVRKGEIDEDDVDEWNEVTAMSIAAVSQVTISKTYLSGFAKFVEVMTDPKRHSQKYVDDLVASFVPFTGLMSAIKNVDDPIAREYNTPSEAVMARIAGLSTKLPPRRNLWGEPMTKESGLGKTYDFIVPFAARRAVDSPIDKELVRLNSGPLRITKKTSFDGVRANLKLFPEVYDDYTRLAGNDLKHPAWGLGAKDFLNAVVSGKHPLSTSYQILPDEGRDKFIQNAITEYRGLAQRHILADPKHRAFMMEIELLKQEQWSNKMPVLGE